MFKFGLACYYFTLAIQAEVKVIFSVFGHFSIKIMLQLMSSKREMNKRRRMCVLGIKNHRSARAPDAPPRFASAY